MGVALMGRLVARLHARRREAVERNLPFRLPGEAAGQAGRAAGQTDQAANPLRTKAGQTGQPWQGTSAAPAQDRTASKLHADAATRIQARSETSLTYGPSIRSDRSDKSVQASDGAGFSRSGHDGPGLPSLTGRRGWDDDRAWIADVVRAPDAGRKLAVLAGWVAAAGGRLEDGHAVLPALPHRLAAVELRRMLRQHGVTVAAAVEPSPEGATMVPEGRAEVARLLAAAERAVRSPDALADEAELTARGEPLP
ncbi:MAG TPA: hypothetical protein VFY87_27100 [Geminicoccaceae bacterium]|nr:hypothetical protein [Geminicoccaceae bacterium]